MTPDPHAEVLRGGAGAPSAALVPEQLRFLEPDVHDRGSFPRAERLYLFTRDTQRQRQRHRQREKQMPRAEGRRLLLSHPVSSIPAVLHPEVGSNRCYCVLGPRAAEEGGRWGPTLGTSVRRPGGAGPPRPSPFSDLVPSSWSEVPPAPPSCSPWGQSRSPTRLCPWGRSPSPARLCPWGRSPIPARLCPWGRSPSPARLCPWGRSPIPARLCPWGRSPSPAFLCLPWRSTSPTRLCPRGQSPSSWVPLVAALLVPRFRAPWTWMSPPQTLSH
ncbi:uncharacterized protein AAEQ78_000453 isoform 1-T1 [Lycaon pictus]